MAHVFERLVAFEHKSLCALSLLSAMLIEGRHGCLEPKPTWNICTLARSGMRLSQRCELRRERDEAAASTGINFVNTSKGTQLLSGTGAASDPQFLCVLFFGNEQTGAALPVWRP